jgi:hypothetical protein
MEEIHKNEKEINNDKIMEILKHKEIYYYKMVNDFFKKCSFDYINKMVNIINGESKISLRILDWFVTKYAHKYYICLKNSNDDSGKNDTFNIHISYKAQLKSYKKKYFDPFRRRKKFVYFYDKNNIKNTLITTIGQLNFFRWIISNKIIEYVEENFDIIIKAMNTANKEDKNKKMKLLENANIKKENTNNHTNLTLDKHTSNDMLNKNIKNITDIKNIKHIIVTNNKTPTEDVQIILNFD